MRGGPGVVDRMREMRIALCVGACLGSVTAVAATPSALPYVASQRGTYELSLAEGASGGALSSASGIMTYAVRDVCSGWSTQEHMRLRGVTRTGETLEAEGDSTALESRDGRHLTFASTVITNGRTAGSVRGEASLAADGSGSVSYVMPEKRTVALKKGTLLPLSHDLAVLRAAQDGAHDLARPLFDGTTAEGAQDSYTTILGWGVPKDATVPAALAGLPAATFHLASFAPGGEQMTPEFDVGSRLFLNDVADRMVLNFGGTRVIATLTALELPDAPRHCASKTAE